MKRFIAGLLLVPTMAHAQFWSGNMLLQRLQSTDASERILATGYIMGVSDTQQQVGHCSGAHVTVGQTRDVVKLYLEQNPSVRDMSADLLAAIALGLAFPCPKTNKRGAKS